MVWQKKAIYLPALIVHFTAGTTVSLFMLLTALVVCLLNLKTLKKQNLIKIFRAYILLLPLFVYLFYQNWVLKDISFSLSLTYTAFYLGIVSFFYGSLISHQMNKSIYKFTIAVLFILPFYSLLPFDFTIRLYWLSLPFFLALLFINFTKHKKLLKHKYLILPIIFIILFLPFMGIKFTLLVSGSLAFLFFIFLAKQKDFFLKFFRGYRLLIMSVFIVVFVMMTSSKNSVYDLVENEENGLEISFSNIDNLFTALKYKAFDDRGMIWKGGFNHLLDIKHFWPTGEVPIYSYTMASGVEIEEVNHGIHNIGLELMRNYGIVIGVYVAVIYFIILGLLTKAAKRTIDYDVKFVLAVLISVGFVGGMVGQFVLQPTFSFGFLCLSGIFYCKEKLDK